MQDQQLKQLQISNKALTESYSEQLQKNIDLKCSVINLSEQVASLQNELNELKESKSEAIVAEETE